MSRTTLAMPAGPTSGAPEKTPTSEMAAMTTTVPRRSGTGSPGSMAGPVLRQSSRRTYSRAVRVASVGRISRDRCRYRGVVGRPPQLSRPKSRPSVDDARSRPPRLDRIGSPKRPRRPTDAILRTKPPDSRLSRDHLPHRCGGLRAAAPRQHRHRAHRSRPARRRPIHPAVGHLAGSGCVRRHGAGRRPLRRP